MTAEKFVIMLWPSVEISKVLMKIVIIYRKMKLAMADTVSIGRALFPNFRWTMALGWSRRAMPRLMNLKITNIRITFIPPLVDEEDAPISIRTNSRILEKVGHKS